MNPQQRGIIAWFAANSVAANLLMISVIVLGLLSINSLRKEAFPPWPADKVTVSVNYDSGDPTLVEEGIAIKVEEAITSVQGIKRVTSVSSASNATITIEMVSGYDLDVLLRDVKAKVDAIYNFPADAENPVIERQQRTEHAYSIKIFGDTDHATLQTLAERLKVELLAQSQINNLSIKGKSEPIISIEVDEEKLQAYQITLSDIANAINAESSVALSTSLRNGDNVIRLKAADQAYYTQEFANIPLITTAEGSLIRLGDVTRIEDTFADDTFVLSRYNGMNGIGIELNVDSSSDVIRLVEQADMIIERWKHSAQLPHNISIETWNDGSELIRDRLSLLIKNALSGIALVFLVLALFLNLRVALWVTAGLPFIFCGTLFFMTDNFTGMTINEMTTFGFILALGIVVDDAVVIGESIYDTRRTEGDSLASTIKGTKKVAVPTIFGVLTTIATFIALSNVEGGMGNVYAQFATIVTICLLLSMVESKLILPSHLAHLNTHRKIGRGWKDSWARLQHGCDLALDAFNSKIYQPAIRLSLEFRYAALLLFIALFIFVVALPFAGSIRVAFFPNIPGSTIEASLSMQNDASFGLTHENLLYLEKMAYQADKELRHDTQPSAINTVEVIASSDQEGSVSIELNEDSPYDINQFTARWKKISGIPQGVKKLNIQSGFGQGDNFKVELKAWDTQTLTTAGEQFRSTLNEINGVSGIDDNFNSGQSQLRFTLTPQAQTMGITSAQLSKQLLQAFGGEIVQRFQRGKDEVKVRVRYPQEARQDVDDILQARIRTPDGNTVPLAILANIHSDYQQNEITRIGGLPSVHVSASTNKDIISPNELVQQLQRDLVPELKRQFPDLNIHFAGEAEEQAETAGSMVNLFIMAMLAIFILLAIPLKSYIQPIIIMTAIPFGLVGAILGHWLNDMTLSVLSFNGIVALSGVVVNDSLLLVSRFNDIKRENPNADINIADAIISACTNRLRPVLLTSVTTFAGLMPLLSETSAQAQFIIPAAASLGYGILFATVITLILIPALLMIQQDAINFINKIKVNMNINKKEQTTC